MLKMVLFPNINEIDVINQAVDEIITSGTIFDFPTDTCDGGISAHFARPNSCP